ncbi:MAG TPA: ribonuclease III domain-containing protein [Candidatus Methanoperedens sp.]|nr:ribonuclease III domain-containing protein [Candidatus Methanoperedens sp.]
MSLEEKLSYKFKDKNLLNRALTRKAYALEQKQQNIYCEDQEIFRTLGDAVLKTVLIDLLIKNGVNSRGEITNRKKSLERQEGLAKISVRLGLGSYLKFGNGETKQRADKEPYVLAETFEAVIGAIYLDGGFDACRKTIEKLFEIL